MLVTHHGLHQVHQVGRGTKHIVRTLRHTELTARTVLGDIGQRLRAWRHNGCLALWNRLILEFSQTAVHQFLLLLGHRSGGGKGRGQEERPLGSIDTIIASMASRTSITSRTSRTRMASSASKASPASKARIAQCPELTFPDAVTTNHAAAIIHTMRLIVDTGGLAVLRAHRAVLALILIEADLQPREAGEETQDGTDGTDGIAVGTPTSPGQHQKHHQRHGGNDKHRQRLHPDIHGVEGVTVSLLCEIGQQVIAQHPDRLQEHRGNAAIGTIWRQQLEERTDTRQGSHHEHHQHGIAQPAHLLRVTVLVLFPTQLCQDVLKHAQRTDDGTIDAPEDERQQQECHDDHDVQRHYGRQELDLGQPAQPGVQRPRKVEEEQRDQCKEHRCKGNTNLL